MSTMMTVFATAAGTLLLLASVASFWYFLPNGGTPHPLVVKPYLASAIPLAMMTAAIFGIGAIAIAIL